MPRMSRPQQPSQPASQGDLLTSREACALLGIKPATLYTYVSRGFLEPVRQEGQRANLYWRDEVEGLHLRSEARTGQGAVAARAMHWGQPVLTSSITEISPQGPRYRGHLAIDLARHPGAFENVAELLWTGVLPEGHHTWPVEPMAADIQRALDGLGIGPRGSRMMRVCAVAATALGGGSLDEELRSGSITRYSRQLLFAFAGCCGLLGPQGRFVMPQGEQPLAAHVLEALGIPPEEAAVEAMNAALIVSADHELASPTFAARIAASVGSGLHACVVAALATQRGSALSGGGDIAEDLVAGIQTMPALKARVAEAARRRERLVGFGLPLYPQGDPRAAHLIELAKKVGLPSRQAELACRFTETVRQQLGLHPNIEIGLVLLGLSLGLPARSAGAIWCVARTAGWIAHVLEQRLVGTVLRPRSHFQSPLR